MCRNRSSIWWPSLNRFKIYLWPFLVLTRQNAVLTTHHNWLTMINWWLIFSGSKWKSWRDRCKGWGGVQHWERQTGAAAKVWDHQWLSQLIETAFFQAEDHGVLWEEREAGGPAEEDPEQQYAQCGEKSSFSDAGNLTNCNPDSGETEGSEASGWPCCQCDGWG